MSFFDMSPYRDMKQKLIDKAQLSGNPFLQHMAGIADYMYGDPEGAMMDMLNPLQISNLFHGSPYKFTKFADEAMGTGEGAQAFGWGHYLADSPDIARKYQKIAEYKEWKDAVKTEMRKKSDDAWNEYIRLQKSGASADDLYKASTLAEKLEREALDYKPKGNMYKVTINKGKPSSADVFLEWDKPFYKQNDAVRKAVTSSDADIIDSYIRHEVLADKPMEDIYSALSKKYGREGASKYLSSKGITGIKYPSGTLSGVKNSPHYNYVVFNPEDITIDAVNDIPLEKLMWGEMR